MFAPLPHVAAWEAQFPMLGWTLSRRDEQLPKILLPSPVLDLYHVVDGARADGFGYSCRTTRRRLTCIQETALDTPCPYAYPLSGKL